jgi:2'-5' RNA ligase
LRLFIAIELNDGVKHALGELEQRLQLSDVSAAWVREEQIHLTLRFLGEVGVNETERLSAILEARCAGVRPFTLRVSGVGVFPSSRQPAVVWAGVCSARGASEGGLAPGLVEVRRIAEDAALAIRLPKESKMFHPHLTLARVRNPKLPGDLMAYVKEEKDFDGGEFRVNHVSLFASDLTPEGAKHRLIKEFLF